MIGRINRLLDRLSEYLARRKGLLPVIGLLLITGNFILQFTSVAGFLAESDLLLHLGVIVAVIGFLLAWAL